MSGQLTDLPLRFINKIMPTPDGCWLWTGAANRGYGRVQVKGKTRYAHREVYQRLVGPIEADTLDHLCRQPSCVNPRHLEPVSCRVNVLRGVGPVTLRAKQTHCHRGHPFDDGNTYIQPNGTRSCRLCHQRTLRKYWSKRGKDWYQVKTA